MIIMSNLNLSWVKLILGRVFTIFLSSIDATAETGRFGRLINHSRGQPNLFTKVYMLGGQPRLLLKAKLDILPGTELQYDYGDR